MKEIYLSAYGHETRDGAKGIGSINLPDGNGHDIMHLVKRVPDAQGLDFMSQNLKSIRIQEGEEAAIGPCKIKWENFRWQSMDFIKVTVTEHPEDFYEFTAASAIEDSAFPAMLIPAYASQEKDPSECTLYAASTRPRILKGPYGEQSPGEVSSENWTKVELREMPLKTGTLLQAKITEWPQ